eukprot:1918266-Rhodomonas_salina.1
MVLPGGGGAVKVCPYAYDAIRSTITLQLCRNVYAATRSFKAPCSSAAKSMPYPLIRILRLGKQPTGAGTDACCTVLGGGAYAARGRARYRVYGELSPYAILLRARGNANEA